MQRRLVVSLLALVVVALTVFTVPVGLSLAQLLRSNLRETVLREARTIALLVPRENWSGGAQNAVTQELRRSSGARVELLTIGPGTVAGGTFDPRGDLAAAAAGRETTRWDDGSAPGGPALVVTVPAGPPDAVTGAVRLTYPTQSLNEQIRGVWLFRLVAGLATLALTAVLAVVIARSLNRPLRELRVAADRLGRGDLGTRAPEIGPPETREVARALNDGAHRLEGLVSAQRRFVADASHQLRSPLTALRLTLDNAQDEIDDPSARTALDGAIAEVVRMSRLTDGLLALARAEADITAREALDVPDVVRARADAWQAAAADRDVHLAVDVRSRGWVLLGPGHLEQVLDNLVANALDAVPGGTTVTLAVSAVPGTTAHAGEAWLEIVVRDEGPGLSPEDRLRAFDRFWRARPGGTGLGLAVVRQLVEDNHGTVTLAEAPGGGLEVRMCFPRLPERSGGA